MDYQLTQTGAEVQGILNQAPGVVSQEALNTIDTVGVFYVKNEEDNVSGLLFCYEEKDDFDTSYYTQVLLLEGKTLMRAGLLPLTDPWINYDQQALDGKVDKRTGYGLSKNDFTDYYKGSIGALQQDVTRLTEGKLGWEFVSELPGITYDTIRKVYFIQSTVDANCVDAYIVDTSATPRAWKQIGKSIDTSVFYQKPATGIPKTDLAAPVQTSLGKADTSVQPAALTPIQNAIDGIEAVIPSEASAQNQLADKNYVDTHSSDVDDALSTTSENPVQNKVVTNALNGKQATISDLSTIRSGAAAGATSVQPAALQEGLAGKQDTISDLSTIRSGAAAGATAYQKPNTGIPKTDLASAVQTSLGKADTALQPAALTPIQNAIDGIEAVIPSEASAQNQLADKNYVDTHSSDVDDALSTTSENPVQNKVVTNALNGKQATISDLSTIRSGAAAGATAVQPATMNTALASKQDTLTFDNAPTANSNNPVKSGGVKTAIDAKQDTISTVNVTVDNNTGTPSGSASVSGGTLSLSFQNLKGATGAQGLQGIQGVQGVQGPKGDTGVTGDASSLAIIHGIDKTSSYGTTDVCGADAAQALLNEIEGGFYY